MEKWIETGEERGPLGYPATDEEGTPDGVGRYNRFALGMIYWHPQYGAHHILSPILPYWASIGFERSHYGYPTSDPLAASHNGLRQDFQHDSIYLPGSLEGLSYACNQLVGDFLRGKPDLTDISYACTANGIFVSGPGFQASFLPDENSYEITSSRINTENRSATTLMTSECDMYQPVTVSDVYRKSDYIAPRSVHTCIGKMNLDTFVPYWSRLFNYQFSLNLQQRRHHVLTVTNLSTSVPDGEFNAMFRLRRDRFGRDVQISHAIVKLGATGDSSKTADFDVPDNGATYFVEHNHASLSIPSLGYNMNTGMDPQTSGLGIKLPNYSCPEIIEGQDIDLCSFN